MYSSLLPGMTGLQEPQAVEPELAAIVTLPDRIIQPEAGPWAMRL